jgi:hypothetical protein
LTVGNPDRAAREPDLLSPTGTPAAVHRLPG